MFTRTCMTERKNKVVEGADHFHSYYLSLHVNGGKYCVWRTDDSIHTAILSGGLHLVDDTLLEHPGTQQENMPEQLSWYYQHFT